MNEEELNKKSLYSLRGLAREIGVKAPTQKTKNELIKAIIDVYSGRVKPVKKSTVGRPVLANLNREDVLPKNCLNCIYVKKLNDEIREIKENYNSLLKSFENLNQLLNK